MELGADACIVDANDGLVLQVLQLHRTADDEVALAAIENDDVVLVDGLDDGFAHVAARAGERDGTGAGYGLAACNAVIVTRGERRAICPAEGAVEVWMLCRERGSEHR